MLEMPVTMTQDYMLFYLSNDYSLELWKNQIELISKKNALLSSIVHPDYIAGKREQSMYQALLTLR